MPKEKVYVPVVEPKSTSYLEIKELGRIVKPNEALRQDEIFVRVLKINRGNPEETFETEETWQYEVPWPKEEVEVKVTVPKKQSVIAKLTGGK